MLVSGVQPVTTLRALFWVVCSFWRLVSDMIGYQTVLTYSMTGKIIVLYMAKSVSFCLPQEVEVSAFSILIEESALFLVILACSPNVRAGSNVSPSILEFLTVARVTL